MAIGMIYQKMGTAYIHWWCHLTNFGSWGNTFINKMCIQPITVNDRQSAERACVKAELTTSVSSLLKFEKVFNEFGGRKHTSVFCRTSLPGTEFLEFWRWEEGIGMTTWGPIAASLKDWVRLGSLKFHIGKSPIWFYIYYSFRIIYFNIFAFS